MKNKVMIFAMAAVAMLAVSCQKDRVDGMMLIAEGFNGNGQKVLVDGNASTWATGDEVRINNQEASVSVTSSAASVHLNEGVTAPFYGVYPASIYDDNDGANYTLDLPATYTYAISDGKQNLASPMVGYTTDNSTMVFKHLTAAITVQVVNYCGFTIQVDSIIVSSNNYKLNGELNVTIGAGNPTVTAATTSDADAKKVTMLFNGSSSLQVFAGDSANVQVPVLPVGVENKFTVRVVTHKVDQPAVKPIFEKEQGSKHSLARAYLGYARTTFGGLFSVSDSKKVIISQGNLQYQASTGTWKFAWAQYGSIGNAPGNNNYTDSRSTQSDSIDLFGWGTSGWSGSNNTYYMPYDTNGAMSTSVGYGYGPKDGNTYTSNLTGNFANADWGVYNAIANGGNQAGRWRSLTGGTGEGSEWGYLISTREASTVNGVSNARCAKVSVASVCGYIIFPDEYVQPADVAAPTSGGINPSAYIGWTDSRVKSYTAAEWMKMEANGAVFLPSTGYRTYAYSSPFKISFQANNGYYWSSTYYTSGNAYVEQLGTGTPANSGVAKRTGAFVRLVRDVN